MCVGCAWNAQQSVDVGSARDHTMPALSSGDAKHDPTLEIGVRLSLLGNSWSVPNGAFLLSRVFAEGEDLTRCPTIEEVVFRNTALVRTTGGVAYESPAPLRLRGFTAGQRLIPEIMAGADHGGSDASGKVWALKHFEVWCAMANATPFPQTRSLTRRAVSMSSDMAKARAVAV